MRSMNVVETERKARDVCVCVHSPSGGNLINKATV